MKTIKNQAIAGTHVDSQGERNSKKSLELFAAHFAGTKMPINQNHDFSLPVTGFAENLHVVPDENSPGDWILVGDIQYNSAALTIPVGGLSISFLELLRESESQELFEAYLPYPYYNDHELVEEIFEEGFVSVGRWAKKAAEPEAIALIGTAFVFFLKPVWEDLYKTQIAPKVYRFFSEKFGKLREKNISANFVQHVVYNDDEIEVLMIPARGHEEQCFNVENTNAAMELVHSHLTTPEASETPPKKIYLLYDEVICKYVVHRVDRKDGPP